MAVKDLRKLARMQDCMIRIPGYCTHNPEETVLCHVRLAGITGIGRKSPDLIGAWGCAACHSILDTSKISAEQKERVFMAALARQIEAWKDITQNMLEEQKTRDAARWALDLHVYSDLA